VARPADADWLTAGADDWKRQRYAHSSPPSTGEHDWEPDGWLSLTASSFNQLGQYTSSPGGRGYCYIEFAIFFPRGGRNQ